jgi:hypothetical protein
MKKFCPQCHSTDVSLTKNKWEQSIGGGSSYTCNACGYTGSFPEVEDSAKLEIIKPSSEQVTQLSSFYNTMSKTYWKFLSPMFLVVAVYLIIRSFTDSVWKYYYTDIHMLTLVFLFLLPLTFVLGLVAYRRDLLQKKKFRILCTVLYVYCASAALLIVPLASIGFEQLAGDRSMYDPANDLTAIMDVEPDTRVRIEGYVSNITREYPVCGEVTEYKITDNTGSLLIASSVNAYALSFNYSDVVLGLIGEYQEKDSCSLPCTCFQSYFRVDEILQK